MEDTKLADLLEEIGADLTPWHERSGAVFYSGRSTLKKGDFYLMGLNPGGDPKEITESISASLSEWKQRQEKEPDWSEYRDGNWGKGKGNAPHQLRVRYFCENLLGQDVSTIFSANALFVRTPKGKDLQVEVEYKTLLADCWNVHQRLLCRVRPKVIVCFGNGPNSSFSRLKEWMKVLVKEQREFKNPNRKRAFFIRWFDRPNKPEGGQEFDRLNLRVVGVPHPSWFDLGSEEFRKAWESLITKEVTADPISEARFAERLGPFLRLSRWVDLTK